FLRKSAVTFPCRNNRPLKRAVPGAWRACWREPAFSGRSVGLSARDPWVGSKNPAEWPGRGLRPRRPSGRGDAAEGPAIPIHSRALSSARERALIFYLEGLLGEHFIEVVADHGVAFTGDLFEPRAIDDVDEPTAVADEIRALQQAGGD